MLWVAAPAGSGKTTLISSYLQERKRSSIWYQCDEGDRDLSTFFYYMSLAAQKASPRSATPLPLLTPEYLLGLPTFTRRYFEELFGRLKAPFIVVFDNYQEIPQDSPFHEMIVRGLDSLLPGIAVVFISRHEPPAPFARLSVGSRMAHLTWSDLRFTFEETVDVVESALPEGLSRSSAAEVYAKTDGWGAAIALLVEMARRRAPGPGAAGDFTTDRLFDYFAAEVFGKTDKEERDFLLQTAQLPTVSVPMAEELTGDRNAGRMLSTLYRHHFFTDRLSGGGQVYQYHPLFRDFLLAQAGKSFGHERLREIQSRAAGVLERAGQDDEAVELYARAGKTEAVTQLILSRAGSLNLQGRYATLRKWLSLVPGPVAEIHPLLLYWRGVSCLGHDLREGREHFKAAFRSFIAAGSEEGALRAWSGVVETISVLNDGYAELDPWIEWLDEKMGAAPVFPSREIEAQVVPQMIIALTVRQPDHPRLPLWRERTEVLMRDHDFEASQRIVFATYLIGSYFILGYYKSAGSVLRELRPLVSEKKTPSLIFIRWQFAEAAFSAYTGQQEACKVHIARALAVSSKTGILVFDAHLLYLGAQGSLSKGQTEEAGDFLKRLEALPDLPANILAEYHLAAAAKSLIEGDEGAASDHYSIAADIFDRTGNRVYATIGYAAAAMLWVDAGDRKKAASCLREARRQKVEQVPVSGFALLMAEAAFALAYGAEARGVTLIGSSLGMSGEHGTVPLPYCPRRAQAVLCAKALEVGLETESVRNWIQVQDLRPSCADLASDTWPWPFRIVTMGRFQIFRHDALLEFSGKAPQKPLELLKALIAYGGRNVPDERICAALWPEADGDLARQSFDSALSRLRKLLGEDDVLIHGARQLSLDQQRCWVDSIALGALLEQTRKPAATELPRLYQRITALYKGRFLPADDACDWAASRGELLKNRTLDTLALVEQQGERRGQWQEAAECCRKALEIDPLAEEFYRRLMICQHRLGQRTEAVKLYRRCRQVLASQLGLEPSVETEDVYASIVRR